MKRTAMKVVAGLATAALILTSSSPVWVPMSLYAGGQGHDYNEATVTIKIKTENCNPVEPPRTCTCQNFGEQTCRNGTSDCVYDGKFVGEPWPGTCVPKPAEFDFTFSFVLRLCVYLAGSWCTGYYQCDCGRGS